MMGRDKRGRAARFPQASSGFWGIAVPLIVAAVIIAFLVYIRMPASPPATPPTHGQSAPKRSRAPRVASAVPLSVSVHALRQFPHNSTAFTQGLAFYRGELFESTGLNGQSSLRKVDLASGQVVRFVPLSEEHFGEGMTVWRERVYMLTWTSHVGFVFDLDFRLLRTFRVDTQGWGLTHDSRHLILSDGSSVLYFLSPKTFKVRRKLNVREATARGVYAPVQLLNELEVVDGLIYANVWMTRKIAVIDPESGLVVAWLRADHLHSVAAPDAVLNGIAFDARSRRLFVTGKLWPMMFEILLPLPDEVASENEDDFVSSDRDDKR